MAETLTYRGALIINVCWCGIRHAVPRELDEEQQRQHDNGEKVRGIYCPLGHTYVPAGRQKVENLERSLNWARDDAARARARADQAEASARAHKGHATRLRKRAKAGTCPCCNRTFKQLARHMASQHPDFEPTGGTDHAI